MTELRDLLKTLLEEEWELEDGAEFVAGKDPRTVPQTAPLVRVYGLASPARPKGAGYDSREVRHRLTVDVRARKQEIADAAKNEVRRILWEHRVQPWPGYDPLEYDDGTDHGGGPGLSVWTIEVTVMEYRQR